MPRRRGAHPPGRSREKLPKAAPGSAWLAPFPALAPMACAPQGAALPPPRVIERDQDPVGNAGGGALPSGAGRAAQTRGPLPIRPHHASRTGRPLLHSVLRASAGSRSFQGCPGQGQGRRGMISPHPRCPSWSRGRGGARRSASRARIRSVRVFVSCIARSRESGMLNSAASLFPVSSPS